MYTRWKTIPAQQQEGKGVLFRADVSEDSKEREGGSNMSATVYPSWSSMGRKVGGVGGTMLFWSYDGGSDLYIETGKRY